MLWKLRDGRFRGYNRSRFRGGGNIKKRSMGWARRLSMLGDTGGRIPCRICLVFNNASECEVSFVFFSLKNMYIYLRVPGLFIDMCVEFITRSQGKQNLYHKHSLTALLISNFDMTDKLQPLYMHLISPFFQVAHSSLSLLMHYNKELPNSSRYPPHFFYPPSGS